MSDSSGGEVTGGMAFVRRRRETKITLLTSPCCSGSPQWSGFTCSATARPCPCSYPCHPWALEWDMKTLLNSNNMTDHSESTVLWRCCSSFSSMLTQQTTSRAKLKLWKYIFILFFRYHVKTSQIRWIRSLSCESKITCPTGPHTVPVNGAVRSEKSITKPWNLFYTHRLPLHL